MTSERHTYRAGVIGCGRMGATIGDGLEGRPDVQLPKSHAPGYNAVDRTDLVAAADLDDQRLDSAAERYGIPAKYTDYREMIETEDLDIVSVATARNSHLEMSRFAAEHGVGAIYCEKPLCPSMAEADELVSACERHDVRFNLGVHRRFIPLYRTIRELVEDGRIGQPRAVIGNCGERPTVRSHSHAADMLCFLNGDVDAIAVQANCEFTEADLDGNRLQVDPTLQMGHVEFENGVHGYVTRGRGYEFQISGEDGDVRTLNNGLDVQFRQTGDDWELLEEQAFPDVQRRSGTVGCIEELVAALDGEGSTSAPVDVAAAGLEICLGWIESARRGGTRVELPLENRQLTVPYSQ